MAYYYITLVVVQLLFKEGSYAYESGAPSSACSDLTPGHGTQEKGNNPFTVTVKRDPSDQLQVTISSSDETNFQGFILQAREFGSDDPTGQFGSPPNHARHLKCGNDMVRNRLQIKITL